MQSKPENFSTYYAEAFKDRQVVEAYRFRPPYPQEVFEILAGLIVDEPRAVLDVGAGSGDIARHCVEFVEQVDAVDFSLSMIERGKQLPNGAHPRLHWIYGKVEDVPLTPPYALITAGSSIHWTDWPRAFPRFRTMLTPAGHLALVNRRTLPMPWEDELSKLRRTFSIRRNEQGSSCALSELETRGFYLKQGQIETAPVPFVQTLDDFIEGLHSRSGFSRERMGPQRAADFDGQVKALLSPYLNADTLALQVVGTVTYGKPMAGGSH